MRLKDQQQASDFERHPLCVKRVVLRFECMHPTCTQIAIASGEVISGPAQPAAVETRRVNVSETPDCSPCQSNQPRRSPTNKVFCFERVLQ